ncbi:AlpA family phage regulatory protein [Vibrio parahaemolyticus]|nr:AlpA family phage regulatory protein [Vibrio parahaemolyticus]
MSRTQAWRLEKRGLFPKRVKLCGSHSVGWRLSEIMNWIESRGADHE